MNIKIKLNYILVKINVRKQLNIPTNKNIFKNFDIKH